MIERWIKVHMRGANRNLRRVGWLFCPCFLLTFFTSTTLSGDVYFNVCLNLSPSCLLKQIVIPRDDAVMLGTYQ